MEKKYNVLVKIKKDNGEYEFLPVSPTNGNPYEFTKEECEKYIETYSRNGGEFKIQEI